MADDATHNAGARPRLLYLVQLPPPMHGVSAMNERVYRSGYINQGFDREHIDLGLAQSIGDLNQLSVRKILRQFAQTLRVLFSLARYRPRLVYLTPMPAGAGFLKDLPVLLLLRILRIRRVIHLHGLGISRSAERPANRFLYGLAFGGATIISLSNRLAAEEFSSLQGSSIRHRVVPNTLPVEWKLSCQARLPRNTEGVLQKYQTGFAGDRTEAAVVNILFLSALFESKGVFLLPAIAKRLKRRGLSFCLTIAGEGADRIVADLKAQIDCDELSECVRLVGPLFGEAKWHAYESADIFLLPTFNDYLPLVLLEAMYAGCAIVASDRGAIADLVVHDQNGVLLDVVTAETVAGALTSLVLDPEKRCAMASHGQQRYREHFGGDVFDRRMASVLQDAVR